MLNANNDGVGCAIKMAIRNREIRDRTFVLELNDNVSVEVDCRQVSGRMKLEVPGFAEKSAAVLKGYKRIERKRNNSNAKKSKVIAAGPSGDAAITIDPDGFVFQYDHLFIVDTNTKLDLVAGDKVSVISAIHAYIDQSFEGDKNDHSLKYCFFDATEIRNARVEPERLGWALVLEAIKGSKFDDPNLRIALVVDSHLGAHKSIMRGMEPIIDDLYLPPNIDLLYASADTGKESALNALMSWCDKGAACVLRHILENNPSNPFFEASDGKPFDRSRTWKMDTSASDTMDGI